MDTLLKTVSSIDSWLHDLPARAEEHIHRTGRPLVTLSYAQSLDGCIAAQRGEPLALSGRESMRLTHRLRGLHGAILVGIGTVLADDPQLTVRLVEGENPQPVVLDSMLRMPLSARLLARDDRRPWIFCAAQADAGRRAMLERSGARVLPLEPDSGGQLPLTNVLACLAHEGIRSLMVEGGARVISRFLAANLVDQVVITTAPVWVGGLRAVEAGFGGSGPFFTLVDPSYAQFGADLVTWGRVERAGGQPE